MGVGILGRRDPKQRRREMIKCLLSRWFGLVLCCAVLCEYVKWNDE